MACVVTFVYCILIVLFFNNIIQKIHIYTITIPKVNITLYIVDYLIVLIVLNGLFLIILRCLLIVNACFTIDGFL